MSSLQNFPHKIKKKPFSGKVNIYFQVEKDGEIKYFATNTKGDIFGALVVGENEIAFDFYNKEKYIFAKYTFDTVEKLKKELFIYRNKEKIKQQQEEEKEGKPVLNRLLIVDKIETIEI
jgi:hypothetical protein